MQICFVNFGLQVAKVVDDILVEQGLFCFFLSFFLSSSVLDRSDPVLMCCILVSNFIEWVVQVHSVLYKLVLEMMTSVLKMTLPLGILHFHFSWLIVYNAVLVICFLGG